ncbi:MAG: Do family serine endopeptidase, partial [Candidatus Pacebacteria bacterium]|nr:Do family serine endopeptidase [Candidatus Paceibacterota bacterium]
MVRFAFSLRSLFGLSKQTGFGLRFVTLAIGLAGLTLGQSVSAQTVPKNQIVPQSQQQIQLSFAPIVHRVSPAVVNIFASHKVPGQAASPLMNDPFFRQFFGGQLGGMPPRVENSLGSGVLVRNSGLIVTNFHVIKGAEDIKVVLADRREFDARVLRTDERADMALLKIESKDALPFIELADSDNLEVGDLVLAIGNPYGVGQTVTNGIISALSRTASDGNDARYFIQTDAAINPGNSGGALVTLDGKLAGLNTMILSQSGGFVGIGFAIPANMVKTMLDAGGGTKVVRAWLGVSGQTVTNDIALSMNMSRPTGAIVTRVYPGGPAALAGIQVGDVITTIERKDIEDYGGLRFRIATLGATQTVVISVRRKGQVQSFTVKLTAAPEVPARAPILLKGDQPLAGAVVANLSPAFAEEIGRPDDNIGIIVTEIKNGSNAATIGVLPGDVIVSINGQSPKTNSELAL